jgi:drug/metabolite transporter (DMT)-like permease
VPLFGETPTLAGTLGVALVSAGLGLIAWEAARRTRTMTVKGLGLTALAAAVTAAAVMTDAKGARLSNDPFSYAATIALLNGAMMAVTHVVRGRSMGVAFVRHWPIATFGVGLSMMSYMLFIWSLTRAPVAMVAALRETSMLFAVAIAVVLLRERIGFWRLAAIATMLAGIVLIRM